MKTKLIITESQLKSLKEHLTSEDEFRVNTKKHVGPKDREKRKNPITGYDIDSDELGNTLNNPRGEDSGKYIKPDYASFKGKQNRTWVDTRDVDKR